WIGLQQKNIEVATFYRGTEPARVMPTWYGLFYADGKPKRIAHAFALWSKTAAHATRLETRASATTALWMLAGRDGAGEIALLLANPSDQPTTFTINFADKRTISDFKISISQVSDASEQIQTRAPNNNVVTIGANTVQLIVLTPR
ncbi:MAG: hypothetical protein L0Y55_16595, partial [Anaerolineales bacterium]|nr:hypothetical protein [Anaerolineales bacterium]